MDNGKKLSLEQIQGFLDGSGEVGFHAQHGESRLCNFLNLVASGYLPAEAYLKSGFKATSRARAAASARRLMRRADVQGELARLRAQCTSKLVERVSAHVPAEVQKKLLDRVHRLACAIAEIHRIDEFIESRAKDPEMAKVPGGSTGMVAFEWRRMGDDEKYRKYSFDYPLLDRRLKLLKYTVNEVGDYAAARHETTGDRGGPNYIEVRQFDYSVLTLDEIRTLQVLVQKLKAAKEIGSVG